MANFDFIEQSDFKASIESDFRELKAALESKAWKSAHVIAGSIVEALLTEYLVVNPPKPAGKNPLSMDFSELIESCKKEKVISARTADLCSVIRSYRNLIHAGRMVRLQEPAPDESSAKVAGTLVDIISTEVGSVRAQRIGMTASQIVTKLLNDEHTNSILKRLLNNTSEAQRAELLLTVIPDTYFSAISDPYDESDVKRLPTAFRTTFEVAGKDTKRKVAKEFIRMLREADGGIVESYRLAFLHSALISEFDPEEASLVKDYLFSVFGQVPTIESLDTFDGLESILHPDDAERWVDPIVIAASGSSRPLRERAVSSLGFTLVSTGPEFESAVKTRLDYWEQRWIRLPSRLEAIKELKAQIF